MEEYDKVQKLQNGHGDWNDLTRKVCTNYTTVHEKMNLLFHS